LPDLRGDARTVKSADVAPAIKINQYCFKSDDPQSLRIESLVLMNEYRAIQSEAEKKKS
jgi:hypothetical protein